MNKFATIMAVLAAGALAAQAQPTPATNAPAVSTNAAPPAATNAAATETSDVIKPMRPTNMVRMDFHDVPLRTVLQALSAQMGFVFSSEVEVTGNATIDSEQPVGKSEVLELLAGALAKNGYALSTNGRLLTITSVSSATTGPTTPVYQSLKPDDIPMSDQVATIVIPVHTLEPVQLTKDLAELVPSGAILNANQAGNAVVMTGRQKDIHRFAEIIAALDKSSVADVAVFVLKHADAKSVADELKEIFQSPDSTVTRSETRQRFRGFGGFAGMGMGGGGGGESSSSSDQKNAADKAVFVSDDLMNAVVASAPRDYFPMITNVIKELDQPNQDVTAMRVFRLRFADAQETANELSDLFPDPTKTADQNSRSAGFRFIPPWMQQSQQANNESPRMKMQQTVRAVPDMRTASVIVTASPDMLDQIAGVIADLDKDPAGTQSVYAWQLSTADPQTVSQALQSIFIAPTGHTSSSSSSSTSSPLIQRQTGAAQNASQSQSTTQGFGSGSSGSGGLH